MMDREPESLWRTVGEYDPVELVEARLQLHWAVQPVMAFADCALEKASDDSQANLGWRDDFESLVGRQRLDGLSAGLRIPDMSLLVFNGAGSIAEDAPVEGRTVDEALGWLGSTAVELTGKQPESPIRIRDYEMPDHPVGSGAVFKMEDPPAFVELARWFANGDLALRALAARDDGWAEVRCWPHHLDLGTLLSLETSRDASSGRSIGVGMSPGDTSNPEPYFYVNPYSLADPPAHLPSLESNGHWHTEGWFGAVLSAAGILETPEDSQEAAVLSFLRGATDAARGLLT